MHDPHDMPLFETLADFVTYLEETLGHDVNGPDELSSSILDSQRADLAPLERGVRYICERCCYGMVVYGRSDGLGFEYGPRGGLDIVAECAIAEPCSRQTQPSVRVIVQHLLPVPVEEPDDDERPYWLDPREEPEDDESLDWLDSPENAEPDTLIVAEGIGVLRIIKGRRDRL